MVFCIFWSETTIFAFLNMNRDETDAKNAQKDRFQAGKRRFRLVSGPISPLFRQFLELKRPYLPAIFDNLFLRRRPRGVSAFRALFLLRFRAPRPDSRANSNIMIQIIII
jgi:hypothetical protein